MTKKLNLKTIIFAVITIVMLVCGAICIANLELANINIEKRIGTKINAQSSSTLSPKLMGHLDGYNIVDLIVTNDSSKVPSSYDNLIDVSELQDGTINAYLTDNVDGTQNCVIYSESTIYAPVDSSYLFGITTLKTINLEGLNTTRTTDMSNMFSAVDYDSTIEGIILLTQYIIESNGGTSDIVYEEGMTFLEFGQAMGLDTTDMTDDDVKADLEAEIGLKFAQSGPYDFTQKAYITILYQDYPTIFAEYVKASSWYELWSMMDGEEEGGVLYENGLETDGQAQAYTQNELNSAEAYTGDSVVIASTFTSVELNQLTDLNISNLIINEGTDVTDMFAGLTSLKTLYAPAECHEEIILPATMYKEGTSTEYASLSSSTNSLVLLDTANGTVSDEETTTPTTGFVDEKLLPAFAIGLVSIIIFACAVNINKKKKYN